MPDLPYPWLLGIGLALVPGSMIFLIPYERLLARTRGELAKIREREAVDGQFRPASRRMWFYRMRARTSNWRWGAAQGTFGLGMGLMAVWILLAMGFPW